MNVVALIPGLLAAYWCTRYGPVRAFLDVYLPTMLLLPDYFRWFAPGLPDPTFSSAAIIPIFVFFMARGGFMRWKPNFIDFCVIGYAFSTGISEYLDKGYADAQNLMFDAICSTIMPYLLARLMIEQNDLRTEFAKRICLLFTIVAFTNVYEARMGFPLIRIPLNPFFPGQGYWVTTFRWGLARAAGPYGHAIVAGMMFLIAYRFARWLYWTEGWGKGKVKYLPIPMPRKVYYTLTVLGGYVLTLVRGPWMGGMASGVLMFVFRSKYRRLIGTVVGITVAVAAVPTYLWFLEYTKHGREGAQTASQETVAYRRELIEKYTEVIMEKPYWGWGKQSWPEVPGMPSIDNNFLLIGLNHGLIALLLFHIPPFVHIVRLSKLGAKRPRGDPAGLLAHTFVATYLGMIVSLATVGILMNIVQFFFLTIGWAQGLSERKVFEEDLEDGAAEASGPALPYRFQRIMGEAA